jgi:hypothetical protein
MKKVFLLALAGAITIGSFAADKGKKSSKKSKKAHKTEQVCPVSCPRTGCYMM